MDVLLIGVLLTVSILLCGEPYETLGKQVDLQWLETGDKSVDTEVIFEPVDQVRVGDILRDNVARFALDVLLLTDHFDSTATRLSRRLHNIHVLEAILLAVHLELSEVLGEQIGSWTEVKIWQGLLHTGDVLPHQVFSAHLERLREMVDPLVLGGVLQ